MRDVVEGEDLSECVRVVAMSRRVDVGSCHSF